MSRSRLRGPAETAHVILIVGLLAATPAAADTTDGSYGRFDGDLDISVALGASFAKGGPAAAAFARAMYLGTAGIYATYSDALGAARPVSRSASFGIGLRPLFLPRWGYDLEQGPPTLDLALDALTLDIGALFASHHSRTHGTRPGIEVALGTEVPLLGKAAGPWIGLRGALQWQPEELAYSGEQTLPSARVSALLTLSWHAIIDAHIVDTRDRSLQ
jgi:hypothetical protein